MQAAVQRGGVRGEDWAGAFGEAARERGRVRYARTRDFKEGMMTNTSAWGRMSDKIRCGN